MGQTKPKFFTSSPFIVTTATVSPSLTLSDPGGQGQMSAEARAALNQIIAVNEYHGTYNNAVRECFSKTKSLRKSTFGKMAKMYIKRNSADPDWTDCRLILASGGSRFHPAVSVPTSAGL